MYISNNKNKILALTISLLAIISAFCVFFLFFNKNVITSVNAEQKQEYWEKTDFSTITFNGSGSQEDPYLIEDETQLAKLANDVNSGSTSYTNKYFKQTKDLDLSTYFWTPIGNISPDDLGVDSHSFEGSYDGAGFSISGLKFHPSKSYVCLGLFGYIYNNGDQETYLKNITLTDVLIKKEVAKINSKYIGALAGIISGMNVTVENCTVKDSTIYGSNNVGGFIGKIYGAHKVINNDIHNSEIYIRLLNLNDTYANVGGIVGSISGQADYDYGFINSLNDNTANNIQIYYGVVEYDNQNVLIQNVKTSAISYNIGGLYGAINTNSNNFQIKNNVSKISTFKLLQSSVSSLENLTLTSNIYLGGLVGSFSKTSSQEQAFDSSISFKTSYVNNIQFNLPMYAKTIRAGGFVGNIESNRFETENSFAKITLEKSNENVTLGGLVGFGAKTAKINTTYTVIKGEDLESCGKIGYFFGSLSSNATITNSYAYKTDKISLFNAYMATETNKGEELTKTNYNNIITYNFDFETTWKISSTHNDGFPYLSARPSLGQNISSAKDFESGNGTKETPYLISSAQQFILMAESVNNNTKAKSYFKLTSDIDLTGYSWTPIGTDKVNFSGSFDGDGHTITGLSFKSSDLLYYGLFGFTSNAEIKNFEMKDIDLTIISKQQQEYLYISSIVAYGKNTSISCVNVSGNLTVYAEKVKNIGIGGIAGYLFGDYARTSKISDCYSDLEIDVTLDNKLSENGVHADIGGLIGKIYIGEVLRCYTKPASHNSSFLLNINYYSNNISVNLGGFVGLAKNSIDEVRKITKIADNFTTAFYKNNFYPNTLTPTINAATVIGKLDWDDSTNKNFTDFEISNNHFPVIMALVYNDYTGCTDFNARYDELQDKNTEYNQKMSELLVLQNEISDYENQVSILEGQLKDLIENVQNDVDKMKAEIAEIKSDLAITRATYETYLSDLISISEEIVNFDNTSFQFCKNFLNESEADTINDFNNSYPMDILDLEYNSNSTSENIQKLIFYCDWLNVTNNLYVTALKRVQNVEIEIFGKNLLFGTLADSLFEKNNALKTNLSGVQEYRAKMIKERNDYNNLVANILARYLENALEDSDFQKLNSQINALKDLIQTKNANIESLLPEIDELYTNINDPDRSLGDKISCDIYGLVFTQIPKIGYKTSMKDYMTNCFDESGKAIYDFNTTWLFVDGVNDNYPVLRVNFDKNTYNVTQNNISAGNVNITGIVKDNNLANEKQTLSTSKDKLTISFKNIVNDPYTITASDPKAGYKFVNWEIKQIENGEVVDTFTVTGKVLNKSNFSGSGRTYELTANYEEIEYTVTFKANGYGVFESKEDDKVVYVEEITEKATVTGIKEFPKVLTNIDLNTFEIYWYNASNNKKIIQSTSIISNDIVINLMIRQKSSWNESATQVKASEEGVFEIETAEQLAYIANCFNGSVSSRSTVINKTIKLVNNIDLSGRYWTPIQNFKGTFDGNGYKIIGLELVSPYAESFIYNTYESAVIKNVQLTGVKQTFILTNLDDNNGYSALITKAAGEATIENCLVETEVTFDNIYDNYTYELNDTSVFHYGAVVGIIKSDKITVYNNVANIQYSINEKNNINNINIAGIFGENKAISTIKGNLVSISAVNNATELKTRVAGIGAKTSNTTKFEDNYYITTSDFIKGIATVVDSEAKDVEENAAAVKLVATSAIAEKIQSLNLANTSKLAIENNYLYFEGYKATFSMPETNIENSATINLSSSGSVEYAYGDKITLHLTPIKGYKFIAWKLNDTVVSIDPEFIFTLTPSYESGLIAEMEYQEYTLKIGISTDDKDNTTCKVVLNDGEETDSIEEQMKFTTSMKLKAVEGKGMKFLGWYNADGEKVYEDLEITIEMPSDNLELTAKFEGSNKLLVPLIILIGSIVLISVISVLLVKKKRKYQQNKLK